MVRGKGVAERQGQIMAQLLTVDRKSGARSFEAPEVSPTPSKSRVRICKRHRLSSDRVAAWTSPTRKRFAPLAVLDRPFCAAAPRLDLNMAGESANQGESAGAPSTPPPERRDEDRDENPFGVFSLIVLFVLVAGGLLLIFALRDMASVQDCVWSGRRNCAPIDVLNH
jgi:hypothetical protein